MQEAGGRPAGRVGRRGQGRLPSPGSRLL